LIWAVKVSLSSFFFVDLALFSIPKHHWYITNIVFIVLHFIWLYFDNSFCFIVHLSCLSYRLYWIFWLE
jgi:hypothetical protein